MKKHPLAVFLAGALFTAATARPPIYRLDADLQTLRMVDCGYYGSKSDLGRKNTIASNIDWAKYAPGRNDSVGNDSAVALMALKFRDSFPAEQAAVILPMINGDTIRSARFLSENDTARIFMLFFPSSGSENVDTLRIIHPDMGTLELPGINFMPRSVYTVELRRCLIDSIPQ